MPAASGNMFLQIFPMPYKKSMLPGTLILCGNFADKEMKLFFCNIKIFGHIIEIYTDKSVIYSTNVIYTINIFTGKDGSAFNEQRKKENCFRNRGFQGDC